MNVLRSLRASLGTLLVLVAALLCAAALSPAPARAADSTFTINGRGWGHGIGLSQYGAKGYADQGKTYDWILAHYFQQTDLSTRTELTVKVDLDNGKDARTKWDIAPGGSTTMTVTGLTDATNVVSVPPKTRVWVTFVDGKTRLYADKVTAGKHSMSTKLLKAYAGSVIAASGSQAASLVKLMDASGPMNHTGITWRGVVRFSPSSDTSGHAVNYVGMENYLRGVVPRESPSSWDIEALKAQAVAARSYAYDSAASGSTLWCTTMSQVYGGHSDSTGRIETDRTDTAVKATANKVVTYGSTIVKTFFSSSSGGRTANSKDVWFSSKSDDDSPVYYTSVTDADTAATGNPNYRWSLTTMSGTTLAGKIRAYNKAVSVASPATITDVSLDPGTSGFVRYITLKWSNGKSFEITGPQFQSALRLKSSAFTVTVKKPAPPAPPAPTATRFQQPDGRLVYAGTWTGQTGTSFSGGSYRYATKAGAQVTAAFKGTSISWIGTKAHTFGKADVYLDGVRQTTVDLYSATALYRRALWTKTKLSADTTHTLVIKVLGTHGTHTTGTTVGVDAFDVDGTLVKVVKPPVWSRSEETSSTVAYAGSWTSYASNLMSGGAYRYASSASACATFTFTGSRVRWIGRRGNSFGRARVSLDGGPAVLVDLYASASTFQLRLWDSGDLAQGKHTLAIRPAHTKDSHSRGYNVGVDAFDALVPAP